MRETNGRKGERMERRREKWKTVTSIKIENRKLVPLAHLSSKNRTETYSIFLLFLFYFYFPLISSVGSRWATLPETTQNSEWKKEHWNKTKQKIENQATIHRVSKTENHNFIDITHVSSSLFVSFTTHNLHIRIH